MLTELRLLVNSDVRIYVSGANGNLGSKIVNRLSAEPDTSVSLLRRDINNSYVADLLGQDNDSIIQEKVFIHCGWDVSNRKLEAQKESMEETKALARICESKNIRMVFLSSKSASDSSSSNYGAMKYSAEKHVLDSGGVVLRPGLILFDPPRGIQKRIVSLRKNLIQIKFQPDIILETIDVERLLDEIEAVVRTPEIFGKAHGIRNEFIGLNQLAVNSDKKSGIVVHIPLWIVKKFLEYTKSYNTKIYSLHDSFKAIY